MLKRSFEHLSTIYKENPREKGVFNSGLLGSVENRPHREGLSYIQPTEC
jgi:hypothetical protein